MGKIKKEKISKNSHEKKDKVEVQKKRKNVEKKKGSTEESSRKYGYISAKSVITMAESAGFPGLQEDVARKLAEDVTYRLRYIIQVPVVQPYTTTEKRIAFCENIEYHLIFLRFESSFYRTGH